MAKFSGAKVFSANTSEEETSGTPISEGQIFSAEEARHQFGALSFVHEARWKGQKLNLYAGYDQHFQYFLMEGPFGKNGNIALVCSKIVAIEWQPGVYQKAVAVLGRAASLPALQKMKWQDFSSGFYTLVLGLVFLNFAHVDSHRFGTALAIGAVCWLGYRVTDLGR